MVLDYDRIKVLDFGLAKIEGDNLKLTQSGEVWGTPQYMAPEQLEPEFGEVDAQTDLFAAASILYELVTGRVPFLGGSMRAVTYQIVAKDPPPANQLNPEVGVELSAILAAALEKNKTRRYPSCKELLLALDGLPSPS
jgi:serine/threonine-protein kinase